MLPGDSGNSALCLSEVKIKACRKFKGMEESFS